MKIRAKFKDYYDFVGRRYGEDPDCVYNRGPLPEKLSFPWPREDCSFSVSFKYSNPKDYYVSFVVAGPHVIPFMDFGWHFVEGIYTHHLDLLLPKYEGFLGNEYMPDCFNGKPVCYPDVERLQDLIRLVGAPVFLVKPRARHGSGPVTVDSRIPNLGNLGFASFVSPGQMWQDIYTTMTSVLRKNPDKEPPLTVNNEERIQAAGFDLKTSFRNPINKRVK